MPLCSFAQLLLRCNSRGQDYAVQVYILPLQPKKTISPTLSSPALLLLHRRNSVHRSEEHTFELQSPCNLVCRLLLEKKKKINIKTLAVLLITKLPLVAIVLKRNIAI